MAAAASSSSVVLFLQPQHHPKNNPSRPQSLPSFHAPHHFLTFSNSTLGGYHHISPQTPRRFFLAAATPSTETATAHSEADKPTIELEFIDPKVGENGECGRQKATAMSGEKLLRNMMIENKIELYAPYGKVMNCGGGGSCGTCIVEIVDGQDLLNERTNTEKRYLKKRPETWRLACQTIVGNKENSGKVVVQRLPQWKK